MNKKILRQATCGLILTACALPIMAQTFPTRPVTLVVPHSAGGTTDILARTIAKEITTWAKAVEASGATSN